MLWTVLGDHDARKNDSLLPSLRMDHGRSARRQATPRELFIALQEKARSVWSGLQVAGLSVQPKF